MRIVALIIWVPGRASYSATVSSYEGFKFCIQKMRLVALIILVPGRASNSATVSSYEGFKFCIQKMRLVALIILVSGAILTRQPCRVMKVLSFAYKDAPRSTDHFGTWESL